MVTMFILTKWDSLLEKVELKHTYSTNVRDKYISEGWNWNATITGWNATISYIEEMQ